MEYRLEFFYEYGLFLAKALTVVIALIITLVAMISIAMKQSGNTTEKGQLEFVSLSDSYAELKQYGKRSLLSDSELKAFDKQEKVRVKAEKKAAKKASKKGEVGQDKSPESSCNSVSSAESSSAKKSEACSEIAENQLQEVNANVGTNSHSSHNVFVIDFTGSMQADEVEALRREVTAILSVATTEDEVVVRLESGGGVVHGYGLAAAQLQRIKDAKIKLTVTIDKVAASGGYMMACVADDVICANFAIIGSIGVVAQVPNIHKLLKKNDVDIEMHTAGEYKRTLTMLGENTDEGRAKFKAELEAVHVMFKDFVVQNRPDLNINEVATGEYWYGLEALKKGLVDKLSTSDDVLLELNQTHKVYRVKYVEKKNLAEKLGFAAEGAVLRIFNKIMSSSIKPNY